MEYMTAPGCGAKMEDLCTACPAVLCGRAHRGGAEVQRRLGDPCRCAKAGRRPKKSGAGQTGTDWIRDGTSAACTRPLCRTPMPLMNTAFTPGQCMEYVEGIEDARLRDIALAEYHYFSGQPEEAAREAELYLSHPEVWPCGCPPV